VDPSRLAGSFITSVSTEVTKSGTLAAAITVQRGEHDIVLELSDVARFCIDAVSLPSLVGEAMVRRLPRVGAWPPEAHHLLGCHDNVAEVVWLRLDGPTAVEVVAHGLRVVEAGDDVGDSSAVKQPGRRATPADDSADLDEVRMPGPVAPMPQARTEGVRGPKQLGFFRELPHGDPEGPSLLEARRGTRDDEAAIVRYLAESPVLAVSGSAVYDVIDPQHPVAGRNAVRTDGAWIWPDDLAYYVANYHVELPAEFIEDGTRAQWAVRDLTQAELEGLEREMFGE
jgi:hypothetical protein